MKKGTKIILYVVVLAIICGLIAFWALSGTGKDVTTSEFYDQMGVVFINENTIYSADKKSINIGGVEKKILYNGKDGESGRSFVIVENINSDSTIAKVVVQTYNLIGLNEKGARLYRTSYARGNYDEDILMAFQSISGKTVDYSDPNEGSFFSSLIMPLITIGIGILIIYIFMKQAQGGNKSAMDFGKTKAKETKNIKIRFSDVAGAEEEKQELQEVVEFLKNPKKFSSMGAKIPKGVLLVGPPGTGKTLFAKAVAGEANVPFFSISGSDFVEMFVGVGASRVRDLFSLAKKSMPCIVFIDEIDAVGRQRGAGLGGGNDEREQTLNQLLVQMDGFESNEGIIIMAATNRADILDPALMRPGRFDRQIYVNLPDVRGREAILKVHARNKPLAANVNFKILARMTAGFSGADLANLLNESAILAARANRTAITNEDLYEAIEKVMMGPKKTSRLVTEKDKRITAYHESGHAILAKLLPNCDEVHEVTIIPRGNAGGYTLTRPENDNQYMSKNKLLDDLIMTMGGRAAEELIIKDYTSGASGDIKHASKVARAMVTELGMSEKVGPVNYGSDEQIFVGRDYQTKTNYSEALAKLIDEEVETLIKNAHEQAYKMLQEHKDMLDKMARLLVERETIYSDEVNMLMEGKSIEEIMDYMDKTAEEIKRDPFHLGDKQNGGSVSGSATGSAFGSAGETATNEKTTDTATDSSRDNTDK